MKEWKKTSEYVFTRGDQLMTIKISSVERDFLGQQMIVVYSWACRLLGNNRIGWEKIPVDCYLYYTRNGKNCQI